MQIWTDDELLKPKVQELSSPCRMHHLNFSTCPYEATTSSTTSPDRLSNPVLHHRQSEPKAESTKSNGSKKSKYSQKSILQKSSIFEKVESSRSHNQQLKHSKEKKEEHMTLLVTTDRLRLRRMYLKSQVDGKKQEKVASSARVRTLLRRYFN